MTVLQYRQLCSLLIAANLDMRAAGLPVEHIGRALLDADARLRFLVKDRDDDLEWEKPQRQTTTEINL